jgi:pimeloyl-ACP methyl ester carboxylesterase
MVAGATLVVVEGGPHGVNATHPGEFNRALLDFLGS